jgi:hypothetical protein
VLTLVSLVPPRRRVTVRDAQRCRGLDFTRGSVRQRIARYVPVIVPVVIGGLRRADQMAFALEVRGFSSGRPRTVAPRIGGADLLLTDERRRARGGDRIAGRRGSVMAL